jgi:hypothetical protein
MPAKKPRPISDHERLQVLSLQREILRRLREDAQAKKDAAKYAKSRAEQAARDLELLVERSSDPRNDLVAGSLKVDPKTGEILDYEPTAYDGTEAEASTSD